jgi:hypothetical protein
MNALARTCIGTCTLFATFANTSVATASDLQIASATISADPNADTWFLTSQVCNNESSGHSGSLLYELRLVEGSSFFTIGSERDDTLDGNRCRSWDRMSIDVNTNVPNGTYSIKFVIGEFNNGSFIARESTTFDRTFTRGTTTPAIPTGQNSCQFAFDGECDDGRAGSVTSACSPGTDTADCSAGPRPTGTPTQPGVNSCQFAFDGECDDGRAGSVTSICSLGTDSADCSSSPGPRPTGGGSGGTGSGNPSIRIPVGLCGGFGFLPPLAMSLGLLSIGSRRRQYRN